MSSLVDSLMMMAEISMKRPSYQMPHNYVNEHNAARDNRQQTTDVRASSQHPPAVRQPNYLLTFPN
jgi:hypothetical protein